MSGGAAKEPQLERFRPSLGLSLAVMGIALAAFDLISPHLAVAHRAFGSISTKPPIYGLFRPGFSELGTISIVLTTVAFVGAWAITRSERLRAIWVLPVAMAFMLAFTASIAILNGDPKGFVYPFLRRTDYQGDVRFVTKLGISGFIRMFPQVVGQAAAVHTKTHPPGPVVFFSLLQTLSPHHVIPRAVVMAIMSVLVLIPTWFITRRFGDARTATYAVLLLAVAPAPGLFVFTSMDAVYATMLAGCAALLVWGLGKQGKPWIAFIGGVAMSLVSLFTYAVFFIAAFAVIYAFMTDAWRKALRCLALVGVGGILGLALLRVTVGYDLLACFRASYSIVPRTDRSFWYWVFGNPAVWLTFAGLPIAALGVRELIFERPRYLIAFLIPVLIADLTWIFPGETERIGQFAYPFLAAAAGIALVRWEASQGRRRPWVVAWLVLLAAVQTMMLEALFFTHW